MSTKTDREPNGHTFQWNIENISSYWWLPAGDQLKSPVFIPDPLEGTKWHLLFCPREKTDENDIGVYIFRGKDCSGPEILSVRVELAILGKDDSILLPFSDVCRFTKHKSRGFTVKARKRVFLTDRESFLPEDILTLQCRMQNAEESPLKSKHLFARTVSNVNRGFFKWRILKFSTVQPGVKKNYKDHSIEFNIVLNEDFEKRLDINIASFDSSIRYISCSTSIIDSEGKMENCAIAKYFARDLKKGIVSTTVHFAKLLTENKSRFLPNDVLTLYFQFTFSTIVCFGLATKLENQDEGKGKPQSIAVLFEDFKSLYNDGNLYDTELRTPTKAFPAHKAILSARSPVFRNMFKHDMKENNSGHVDITDLEDDTIHQMLFFLYTARIKDLQLESASKLYAAADKYNIQSLKCRCSSFLKQNLIPAIACDVLILSDLHNDEDLKIAAQDYILEQRKEFFVSQEWKDFTNSYSKLAEDIMNKRMC